MRTREAGTPEAAIHGWLVLDKPQGITSARAVAAMKRATGAKIGHAGTLDPLATGVLPLAFGEATKTVQFATAGTKRYRFRVRWGSRTETDDCEGAVVAETAARPDRAAIGAALPVFTGAIRQRPPAYSAIKVAGRRAYALARAGRPPELSERTVNVIDLEFLDDPDRDHAEFIATVGEGTYIRALARDIAAHLGTLGHVVALRRTRVGRFDESRAISLETAATLGHSLTASEHLLPIETALDDIPALAVTAAEAARLRHGQTVLPGNAREWLRLAATGEGTIAGARCDSLVVALVRVEASGLRPVRIIHR